MTQYRFMELTQFDPPRKVSINWKQQNCRDFSAFLVKSFVKEN